MSHYQIKYLVLPRVFEKRVILKNYDVYELKITWDHSLSAYSKFSEKLAFLTPRYAHVRVLVHLKYIFRKRYFEDWAIGWCRGGGLRPSVDMLILSDGAKLPSSKNRTTVLLTHFVPLISFYTHWKQKIAVHRDYYPWGNCTLNNFF